MRLSKKAWRYLEMVVIAIALIMTLLTIQKANSLETSFGQHPRAPLIIALMGIGIVFAALEALMGQMPCMKERLLLRLALDCAWMMSIVVAFVMLVV